MTEFSFSGHRVEREKLDLEGHIKVCYTDPKHVNLLTQEILMVSGEGCLRTNLIDAQFIMYLLVV